MRHESGVSEQPAAKRHVDHRRLERSPTFWAAVAVGAVLRTSGLFSQVLWGDEAHAFRAALQMPLSEALFAYSATANSPPFNAWLRLLIDLGLQPSELALRIPVWMSGIALLLVVPLWVGRRLGIGVGAITAWLLAVSPMLVFYSRFMRPYAPYALATAAAAGLLFDWTRRPRRATAVAFALAAATAIYLHLLAAPVVVALFLWLLVEAAIGRRSASAAVPLPAIIALGAGTTALIALFAVPAWSHLVELAASRRVAVEATGRDVINAMKILSGTTAAYLGAALWLLAAAGLARLGRRSSPLARLAILLVVVQAIGVPLLSPSFIGSPPILARYLLPILVPVLVLVAVALEPRGTVPRRAFAAALAVVLVAALFLTGPLASPRLYVDSLAWGREILNVHRAEPLPVLAAPAPYALLARTGGGVVELPARATSRFTKALGDYQRQHGLRVRISPGDRLLSDRRLALDSIVPNDPEALRASGARWVVLHRRWADELGGSLGFYGPVGDDQLRRARELLDLLERRARLDHRTLRDAWGPAALENELLAIWDLARIR